MRDYIVATDAQIGISNVVDGDMIAATILLQRMLGNLCIHCIDNVGGDDMLALLYRCNGCSKWVFPM